MFVSIGAGGRMRRRLLAVSLLVAITAPLSPAQALAASQFLPYQAIAVPSDPDAIAIGDVTGDGRQDVIVTTAYDFDPANDFRLLVLAQSSDGGLLPPLSYATAGSYTQRPGSVDVADITGDGRSDVVVGLDRYGIQVFPQLADGTLGEAVFTPTQDSTRIRVGQLDGDDTFDVAGIGWGSDTISVFLNVGNAGLGTGTVYPVRHDGWDDLEIDDLTGDGRDDLVVMSGQGLGPDVSVLARLAGGGFGGAVEYSVSDTERPNGIGVGDTNGDGRLDLVASLGGNKPSSRVALFSQQATGTLGQPVTFESYDIPEPVALADFDHDGLADVATLHGGWEKAGLYRGRPDASLTSEELYDILYASHYNVHGLAVGDVTGDGWADIVEADYNFGVVVLRNRGLTMPKEPGAPQLTSAVPGNGQVALGWSAPLSDGGSPITSYTATATPGNATCTTTNLSCVITGLANNTTYSFVVRARNAIGTSLASNTLTATPGIAPSAPRSLATSPNQASGVGLTWQAPSAPGSSAVTGYRIYRGLTPGHATLLATIGNVLGYSDTAVTNGGTYYYQVAAVNGFSEGPRSAEVLAQRGTAPGAPTAPSATASGSSLTVRWSAPASTGGSPITGYRVYRSTASGGETFLAAVAGTATSYQDKAVAKKTKYFYWVSAVNVLGESGPSVEVSATSR